MISVPTKIFQAVLTKQKLFFRGNGVRMVGGTGKEVPWERARPQSPDILGIMRDWISPGPSQGPSEETEAQRGQWSSEW